MSFLFLFLFLNSDVYLKLNNDYFNQNHPMDKNIKEHATSVGTFQNLVHLKNKLKMNTQIYLTSL
jgi:hypothetical protein